MPDFPEIPSFPDAELPYLTPLFSDPAWPRLALLLRMLFLAGFAVMMFRLHVRARAERRESVRAEWPRALSGMVGVCLVLIAGRQAGWQLFGRRNDDFVRFMQRYDRREFNPAHQVRAGRILDRHGRVLAFSRVSEEGIRRHYAYGPLFSHVIGYNHPMYGMTGLEAAARPVLLGRGLRGREDFMALGAELLDRETHAEGPALTTTLDVNLQHTAYDLLEGRRGAVVLMDVRNGDVLVLLSRPDFDPNRLHPRFFSGQAPDAPLLNRALSGRYPPGSVFKVLTSAAALEGGFSGTLDTPPEGFTTSAANPPIRDHDFYMAERDGRDWRGHGRIGLGRALAISSNVFFAQLGPITGWDELSRAAEAAGLTESFPLWERAEATLTQPRARIPELGDHTPYGLAQFSIGQGDLLVSPLQMAMITAAVARGGETVYPRLDAKMRVRTGGRLCGEEEADTLKWMMYRTVTEGTARGMGMSEIAVAGKTGTAQTGAGRESHSWFVGFAPVSEPRWAFCVLIEHGGYGSGAALPVARELLQTGVRRGWLVP